MKGPQSRCIFLFERLSSQRQKHPQLHYSVLPCVIFRRKKGKGKTLEFDSLELNLDKFVLSLILLQTNFESCFPILIKWKTKLLNPLESVLAIA